VLEAARRPSPGQILKDQDMKRRRRASHQLVISAARCLSLERPSSVRSRPS
jgi:hypothetical protein